MILVIISVAMLILGRILLSKGNYNLEMPGIALFVSGLVGTAICLIIIIFVNVLAMKEVHANELEYQSLCKRIEIIDSDNNKLSRSELIKDVNNYNIRVMETNYWTENPWTNWFNPRIIADNMRYISWWEGTEGLEE